MSRLAQPRPLAAPPAPVAKVDAATDEFCPVCKSTRYMNKNLHFKMNPICYHKMCSSCVDRIFGHGPATCPIIGCNKTLRKMQFRDQTFEDIAIEREVDIRKEVQAVFTKSEDDFETLQDFNNYLEQIETIAFELVNGIDVAKNRTLIESYKREYGQDAKSKARREANEKVAAKAAQASQKEQAKLDRQAAKREEAEDRKVREQQARDAKESVINGVGTIKEADLLLRKKAGQQRKADAPKASGLTSTANGSVGGSEATFVLAGLKQKKEVAADDLEPYDPFGGMRFEPQYFSINESLDHPELQYVTKNEKAAAGGFTIDEFYNRALCEAFGGLGVFVADELASKPLPNMDMKMVATEGAADLLNSERKAAKARKTLESDDVF